MFGKWVKAALVRAVTLMLIDSDGTVIKNEHLTTAYVPEEGEGA